MKKETIIIGLVVICTAVILAIYFWPAKDSNASQLQKILPDILCKENIKRAEYKQKILCVQEKANVKVGFEKTIATQKAKIEFQNLILVIYKINNDKTTSLSEEDRAIINNVLSGANSWLEANQNAEDYEYTEKKEELLSSVNPIFENALNIRV